MPLLLVLMLLAVSLIALLWSFGRSLILGVVVATALIIAWGNYFTGNSQGQDQLRSFRHGVLDIDFHMHRTGAIRS